MGVFSSQPIPAAPCGRIQEMRLNVQAVSVPSSVEFPANSRVSAIPHCGVMTIESWTLRAHMD